MVNKNSVFVIDPFTLPLCCWMISSDRSHIHSAGALVSHTPEPFCWQLRQVSVSLLARQAGCCTVSWRWSTVKSLLPLGPRGILQPQPGRGDPTNTSWPGTRLGLCTVHTKSLKLDPPTSQPEAQETTSASLIFTFLLWMYSDCCLSIRGRTLFEPNMKALKSRCRTIFANQLFADAFECW